MSLKLNDPRPRSGALLGFVIVLMALASCAPPSPVQADEEAAEPEMILVEAGTFKMGGVVPKAGADEKPLHDVKLPTYTIARKEVTNGAYAKFIAAKGYTTKAHWSEEGWKWREAAKVTEPADWAERQTALGDAFASHPVVGVSYYEAEAYARSVGMRLPTEAEWEKAARGPGAPNVFPWGSEAAGGGSSGASGTRTRPVGTNEKDVSSYGVMDLGGNVAEWTSSWYAAYPGGGEGRHFGEKFRAVRGGSWRFEVAHKRRVAWRGYFRYGNPDARSPMVGIRLAR